MKNRMNLRVRLALAVLTTMTSAALFQPSAHAQDLQAGGDISASMKAFEYRESHYPSFFRLSILAGAGTNEDGSARGFTGGVFADVGRGMLSVETGVQFLSIPASVQLASDITGSTPQKTVVSSQYIGVPLVMKLNYIESPLSTFSVKAGAIPIFMINNQDDLSYTDSSQSTAQAITMSRSDILAVAGFSGTAPISRRVAFLVDGTYFYGTSTLDGSGNSHNSGILLSAGITINL